MIVGSGENVYEVVQNWPKLPPGWSLDEVAGVAVDSEDCVYVFNRGRHPMIVFDTDGNFLRSWGEELFSCPHSVRIGQDGMIYCVDRDGHTVRKLTPEGELVLTLGAKDRPSETGAQGLDFRTVRHSSGPFNYPTDIAFGPSGELFVSDGYGNARVHRFAHDGELLTSWGEPGDGTGCFNLPHAIWIDKAKRLYIADRENSRIQIFTLDGDFITQWRDANRPTCISMDDKGAVYVTELGYLVGLFPGMRAPSGREPLPRLTIRSMKGKVLARWGGEDRCSPGNFYAPHAVCIDSRGDLYVGEVTRTTGAPPGCHTIQKFVRENI